MREGGGRGRGQSTLGPRGPKQDGAFTTGWDVILS